MERDGKASERGEENRQIERRHKQRSHTLSTLHRELATVGQEVDAEESRLLAVRLAEIERPTVGLWQATRGRQTPASDLSQAFDKNATAKPEELTLLPIPKELEPEPKPAPQEKTSARAERLARRFNATMQKRRENERDDYTRDRGYEREP